MSKLVYEVLRDPNRQGLRRFLDRFVFLKDEAVKLVLGEFADASRNLRLHRVPWYPPSRNSSQEILFHCWLLVDQNIARLDEGFPAPNVPDYITLFDQSAQVLAALAVPAGYSVDDAFAKGCHYAASARLIRCLHGILSIRTTSNTAAMPACTPTISTSISSLTEPHVNQASSSHTEIFDFEQVFGEWGNWPYNSTWDMFQSLQDTMPE